MNLSIRNAFYRHNGDRDALRTPGSFHERCIMLKMKYLAVIVISMLVSVPAAMANTLRVYPIEKRITISPGQQSYIALRSIIPPDHHIYGNPKGPGVGKPTILSVNQARYFSFQGTRYLKPVKFYTPGDSNYCWGYEGETYFFIPFSVAPSCPPGEYGLKVNVDALLCSRTTCFPQSLQVDVIVNTGPSDRLFSYDTKTEQLFAHSRFPSDPVHGREEATSKMATPSIGGNRGIDRIYFSPEYRDGDMNGILQALLFSIIAGFILNFMPCVLPVVSLKVMGLVGQARKEGRSTRVQGLLYSAGILSSFIVLAILAAFFGYGWGALFQKQAFLIAMILVVFVFALALFEVFIITPPGFITKLSGERGNIYADAFFKGILTTFLATPCSGPFLGGTLAWALTQPPLVIFVIFSGIGIGMALPYLVLVVNPGLLRFVPRPGEWMVTLERVMGFVLIFTAVYLLSILRTELVLPVITFCAATGLAVWVFGRYGTPVDSRPRRILSVAASLIIVMGGYFLSFHYVYVDKKGPQLRGEQYSPDRLLQFRDGDRVSIVKFTADWCPNCKAVEKLSLNTDDVVRFVDNNNIAFMTADITIENKEAQKLMEKLGSRSIPLLAVFPPGSSFNRPICLRDMYSEREVLDALGKAMKKSRENEGAPAPMKNLLQ